VELLLMKSIAGDSDENVENILSLLQVDLSDKARPDINGIFVNGDSPVTLAAKHGNVNIITRLIDSGAQVAIL